MDRAHTLALLRQQSDGLAGRLDRLSDQDWHRPSLCPGWAIEDIVAHLASGASVQIKTLENGLAGNTSPTYKDPAERAALTTARLDLPESKRAADFRQAMAGLLEFMAGLSDTDMQASAWHQSGVHPLPWFFVQRLGEVTMHRGDVHAALGEEFEYPEEVAATLLPLYVARLPRLFQADAAGDLYAAISFGSAGAVRIWPGGADYVEDAAQPTLRLEADSATLQRIVVGRLHPRDAKTLKSTGDTSLLPRWRELFRTL